MKKKIINGCGSRCIYFCIWIFLATSGLGFQKLAHMDRAKNKRNRYRNNSNYMLEPKWLLGMALIVLDSILDVVTFGLALNLY